jgi:CRISPR-associated protein Cas6
MNEAVRPRASARLGAAPVAAAPPEMVDVAFELSAQALPAGFEWPLFLAISTLAPWLSDSPHAGVHPLRGSRLADGGLLVARRAKLMVRMPRDRVCAASALEGATLSVGHTEVQVGQGTFRKFRPAPTLYSPRVVMGAEQEDAFCAHVESALERLAIRRSFMCGRRVEVIFDGRAHAAFSVAVHGLDEAQSLLLQGAGLGAGHPVGCGLFVPHKTISGLE